MRLNSVLKGSFAQQRGFDHWRRPIDQDLEYVRTKAGFLFRGEERKMIFDTNADSFSSTFASSRLCELKLNGLRLSPTCRSLGPWHAGLCLSETGRTMSYYAYLGPLGEVVRDGASFMALKDGFLIGTYNTFGETMESLAWKGRTKAF
jgi:hypothetical protein